MKPKGDKTPAKIEKPPRADNAALLAEIGRLVRNERAKRGMTRKALAAQSGTSERYLAQIETGEGNPTVLVLDAIARAFGLSPLDLLPVHGTDEVRLRVMDRLRRLTPEQLALVLHSFGGPASTAAARGQRVALVGLRGAGKSTLGALLAQRLAFPFIELDKVIEQEHGAPVSTLFDVYGQATFRRYERECLERVVESNPAAVIATAGGIVADERTFGQLLDRTHVIWLRASPANHMERVMQQGDFRPMARNREAMNDLIAILAARETDYGRSHARLDTTGRNIEGSVEELAKVAQELFARGT